MMPQSMLRKHVGRAYTKAVRATYPSTPASADPLVHLVLLPSRLMTPPCQDFRPPPRPRVQDLPFDEITWENFERLCLRLVRHQPKIDHAQLYGNPGDEQHGIDIFAREYENDKYQVYQCKRESDFGPAKISEAVATFQHGSWASRTSAFVLCTSESLRGRARADEVEKRREDLRGQSIDFRVWDSDELTIMLKSHPEIVDDFFGRAWVRAFCGDEADSLLKDRLDMSRVAELRRRLSKLYRVVFSIHDPGFNTATARVERAAIPLEERFVQPDIDDAQEVAFAVREDSGQEKGRSVQSERPGGLPSQEQRDDNEVTAYPPKNVSLGLESHSVRRRVRAEDWLTQCACSVVLGDPGSGKSTLARFIAIDLLSEHPRSTRLAQQWGALLPVWVPFALWTSMVARPETSDANVKDAIHAWLKQWGEESLWPLVEKALEDNRLLLLVDGLDEWDHLPSAQKTVQRCTSFLSNAICRL
jgi:NACHT domain